MVLHKGSREIHLLFLGRGHTAGDVVVWLPQQKVVATGDLMHGLLPFIGDAYPLEWAPTLDRLREVEFDRVIPGHGGVQQGKQRLARFRNYIEELTALVEKGMAAGQTLEQMQKEIVPASLRSLQVENFREQVTAELAKLKLDYPATPAESFEKSVRTNVGEVYRRLKT